MTDIIEILEYLEYLEYLLEPDEVLIFLAVLVFGAVAWLVNRFTKAPPPQFSDEALAALRKERDDRNPDNGNSSH